MQTNKECSALRKRLVRCLLETNTIKLGNVTNGGDRNVTQTDRQAGRHLQGALLGELHNESNYVIDHVRVINLGLFITVGPPDQL